MADNTEKFFPDDHDTQDILEEPRFRIKALAALSALPVSRSVLTAIMVAIGLSIWLVSGVLVGDSEAVKRAISIAELSQAQKSFAVTTRWVQTETIKREIFLQGRTQADKKVTLAAETNGMIAELPTDKGEFAQKGQIICRIDTGARQALLEEASAMRDARRIEFRAAENLVEKGHTSKSQLAVSRAAYDGAVANVKMRLVELERTKIRAPFDGILDTQPVEVGDFISIGQPCSTIIAKDPLLVIAHISENRIDALSVGARGRAKLVTGEVVNGVVRYIAETPNAATRTFRIELEVPNKDLHLRDGITAEIHFEAGAVRGTAIPQSAMVLNDDGVVGVRVVENNTIVKFRAVKVISDEIGVAYVTGLKESEQLIISGAAFTRDGQNVIAIDEKMQNAPQTAQKNIERNIGVQ